MKKSDDTIKTKLNLNYVLIESLLDNISHLHICADDKKLSFMINELVKYVDSKLQLSENAGDVIEIYVVAEQKKIFF